MFVMSISDYLVVLGVAGDGDFIEEAGRGGLR